MAKRCLLVQIAHYSYAGGVVTIEVWNHFPHSGIGSLVMYFAGIGEIKALLRDLEHVLTNGSTNVQKSRYGSTAMGSAAPTVVQALKVKAKARNATFAEQVCPRCRTSTHIEEEGDRKFETCDECGWSRVAATREVTESAEPIISEDASPEDPLPAIALENGPENRETATASVVVEETPMSEEQPYDNRQQTKAGIGGCLLYPLFFLIVQPILFAYQLYTGLNPGSMMTTRVHWPDMVFNLVQLGAIVILLSLFVRKKAVLPAIFAVFLILFSLLSGVLAKVMMIVPAAGVDWWRSHLVFLLNCVILVPYFVLNTRVKNTFIHEPDRHSVVDGLIKPIADIVEQTYAWLVRQKKWIILYAFVFLIADLALNRALDWALFAIAGALSSS